ncbi:hypothetical protein [Luteolibacter soli]|uniref:Uncharacterized protein n=1 Tax=Luteolibacter soli TaxID=3135280 RepID=A0ABU9ATU6_9BACT
MLTGWPRLSDFSATVGRLATAEDIRAKRAAFLLESEGVRIGEPIDLKLPCYAWMVDDETGDRERCIVLQAEEADGIRYFGVWLIDQKKPSVGLESDFEIVES